MNRLKLIIAFMAFTSSIIAQEAKFSNEVVNPDEMYKVDFPYEEIHATENNREPYRVKVGDVFRISIYSEDQTAKDVVVSPEGSITYLFPVPVPVIGKTIPEIREALETQLKKYYRYPYLSFTPVTFAAEFYTITGEVNQPGSKLIEGNPTLLSALCSAGGFTMNNFRDHYVDFADLDYSFISRNGEYLPVDFRRLLKEGDLSQDIALEPGDYIYIHNRELLKIYVLGEVGIQQTYEYLDTVTLAEIIAQSGGVTLAASSRVVVIRGALACPKQYYIDINLILKGCAPDFELQPGDIVYVPARGFSFLRSVYQNAMRIFVSTVASNAGTYYFTEIQPQAAGAVGPVGTISSGSAPSTPVTSGAAVGGGSGL